MAATDSRALVSIAGEFGVAEVGRRSVATLDHELKFTFPNSRADAALAFLRARCWPDPKYPYGLISSLYYDTHDLRGLHEKINSDYLKTKVRLRWYAANNGTESFAFIEAKRRFGCRRDKVRVATRLTADVLARMPLDDPALDEVPLLLRAHGVDSRAAALQPIFVVRYERRRFIEPLTRARVSLDINISVPAANPRVAAWAPPATLATAVVEIKGPSTEMPPALAGMLQFGCRKSSFSKYAACYQCLARVTP